MKTATKATSLNDAQLMLLQIMNEPYTAEDLEDLRKVLSEFNHRKMQQHLDETVAQKGYTQADFENMLMDHSRKSH